MGRCIHLLQKHKVAWRLLCNPRSCPPSFGVQPQIPSEQVKMIKYHKSRHSSDRLMLVEAGTRMRACLRVWEHVMGWFSSSHLSTCLLSFSPPKMSVACFTSMLFLLTKAPAMRHIKSLFTPILSPALLPGSSSLFDIILAQICNINYATFPIATHVIIFLVNLCDLLYRKITAFSPVCLWGTIGMINSQS